MKPPHRSHFTDQPLAPHLMYQTLQPQPHILSAPLFLTLLSALLYHASQKALLLALQWALPLAMLPSALPCRPQPLAVAASAHPTPLLTKPSSLQRPPSTLDNSTQRLGLPLVLAMRPSAHQAASTQRRCPGSARLPQVSAAQRSTPLLVRSATTHRLGCSRMEHQHLCLDMRRRRQALQRRGYLLSGQALVLHRLALQVMAPNRMGRQQGPLEDQPLEVSLASCVCKCAVSKRCLEIALSAHM